jgi:hypothetical protein
MRWAALATAAAVTAAAGPGWAQSTPAERAREAAAMLRAAGYTVQANQILNACGRPARPRPAAVDLNGDGRPEAVVLDMDPACFGGSGEAFSVIQKQGPAEWSLVGAGRGRIKLLDSRTNGWRDYTLEGPGCQRTWTFQPGQGYLSLKPCPGEGGAPTAATAPPTPSGSAADRAAAYRAAGFTPTRGKYIACDKTSELQIEFRDLNGDGRTDAVITDGGTECYGNTGTGYTIVTKDAAGTWRKLFDMTGIPDFQKTRGVGGWPDIVNGGPGFCFPVLRWNGKDYQRIAWKEEGKGACAGMR